MGNQNRIYDIKFSQEVVSPCLSPNINPDAIKKNKLFSSNKSCRGEPLQLLLEDILFVLKASVAWKPIVYNWHIKV